MRKILRLAACFAVAALFVWTLVLLAVAVSYYTSIPELYDFYGQETLEEQLAKGMVWIAVQALASLVSGGVCFVTVRKALRKRNPPGEKREYHENEVADSKRH